MHSERLLEHFRNPRNAGTLPPPAVAADVSNPACGDRLLLFAHFDEGRVSLARYQVRGCTASIATGSAIAEWLEGKTREELEGLTASAVEEMVGGLESASKHAAALCVDGVRAILRAK